MKNIIEGIIARDNTGWQDEFSEGVQEQGSGVMWKDVMSDMNEILPQLRSLISTKGFFYYYNIASSYANYKMRVVDFATKDSYDNIRSEWGEKQPFWFKEFFDEYSDEKNTQTAVIAFLVDRVDYIEDDRQIPISNFITFNNKQASVKNAVAFTKIITQRETYMEDIKKLLESNKNLILTGAPGTGKTFLAKEIARNMGAVGEQMEFVQFHPSYDYTDFVEGLRPKQDEEGNVGFERKDGVFIEFCKKALESRMIGGSDNFDEVWNNLLDYLSENTYIEIPLLTGTRNIRVELNEYGTGLTERLYSDDHSDGLGEKIPGHSKFFTKEQLHNVYRGEKGVPSGGHDNYRKAIIEYLKKNMGLVDFSAGQESTNAKTFVFIIDEINRGEISKIFGELFFSIDPGYRGEAGKVRTQYANMQTEPNVFDKSLGVTTPQNYGHFYVPDNVYIIGTMNDIDRSVESMDFAFRRRFAFKEILASENTGMLDNLNDDDLKNTAIRRMESLNKEIESCPGLNSSYHIGASYFLKLNNYKEDTQDMRFEQLWNNHLEPLLREYLRGMPEADALMTKLRAAYEMDSNV